MTLNYEYYETPAGVTGILFDEYLHLQALRHGPITVLDPCSGSLAIPRVVEQLNPFAEIWTNDLDPMRPAGSHYDATTEEGWRGMLTARHTRPTWIITNPPFGQAHKIIPLAFQHARIGVALLLPLYFLEPTRERAGVLRNNPWDLEIVIGQPRPSFDGKGTDSRTVFWAVWLKGRTYELRRWQAIDPVGRWGTVGTAQVEPCY